MSAPLRGRLRTAILSAVFTSWAEDVMLCQQALNLVTLHERSQHAKKALLAWRRFAYVHKVSFVAIDLARKGLRGTGLVLMSLLTPWLTSVLAP